MGAEGNEKLWVVYLVHIFASIQKFMDLNQLKLLSKAFKPGILTTRQHHLCNCHSTLNPEVFYINQVIL